LTIADTKREAEVARLTPLRDAFIAGIAGELVGVRVTGDLTNRLRQQCELCHRWHRW
jgi:cysteine sulfinate desulfinase/cysteine desulfurase-like protein